MSLNDPVTDVAPSEAPPRTRPDIEILPGPPPPIRERVATGPAITPTRPSDATPPARPPRRHLALLAGLMALAFGTSLAVSLLLFPRYSLNHDEPMYVTESQMMLEGHLTLPARQADFFRPWAAGVRGDRIVMKYAPPWPGVIAASTWAFGVGRLAPALTAAALVGAVYLLAMEVYSRRRVALIAAALFALSPVVMVQSGTYLPYLFQLLAEVLFAHLVLSGVRLGSWRRLAGAGLAIGVAVFARPFDAVLVGLPFVVLVVAVHRGQPKVALRRIAQIGAGALAPVALTLVYDDRTMGSPLTLPFTVTGRFDTLGFGRRGVFPSHTFTFGLRQALASLDNLRALPTWSFGGLVLVALAIVGLARSRSVAPARAGVLALAAMAVTVTVGYFFFWSPFTIARSWPGLVSLGPFYHLPLLVPLVIFAASAIDEGLRRPRLVPAVGVAAVAMLTLTAWSLPSKIHRDEATTHDLQAVARAVAPAQREPSVVFLPEGGDDGFSSPTPFLDVLPRPSDQVLYATDRGAHDLDLLATMPTRTGYVLRNEIPRGGEIFSPKLVLTRLEVRQGATVPERLKITNPVAGSCVTAYARSGGLVRRVVLDRHSAPGRTYDVTWTIQAAGRGLAASVWSIAPLGGAGTGEVALGVGFGSTCDFGAAERYERRFAVRAPDDSGTTVQVAGPGEGWHRVSLPDRAPFWVRERVDQVVGAPTP